MEGVTPDQAGLGRPDRIYEDMHFVFVLFFF